MYKFVWINQRYYWTSVIIVHVFHAQQFPPRRQDNSSVQRVSAIPDKLSSSVIFASIIPSSKNPRFITDPRIFTDQRTRLLEREVESSLHHELSHFETKTVIRRHRDKNAILSTNPRVRMDQQNIAISRNIDKVTNFREYGVRGGEGDRARYSSNNATFT